MKPGFLRRILEAIFPPRARIEPIVRPEPPPSPSPAPAPPAPPNPVVPLERVVFAFAVASNRAKVLGERLQVLMEAGAESRATEIAEVRARAIQALDDMEAFTVALAGDGHLPGEQAGQVMVSIVKARISLGVSP